MSWKLEKPAVEADPRLNCGFVIHTGFPETGVCPDEHVTAV